jgi:uncharacterized protein YecT (DUF1311 family)
MLVAAAMADCSQALTTIEINACLTENQRRAELALTDAYARAIATARKSDVVLDRTRDKRIGSREALVRAERAWIAYRDAHCVTMAYTMRGGSGEGTASAACKLELTEVRIQQLHELGGE